MFGRDKRRVRNTRRENRIPTVWRNIIRGTIVCIVIGLLLWGVWYVTRLPHVTFTNIEITGGETISHDDVRSILDEGLRGSYLGLIPYRFTFFYPHDALIRSLRTIDRIHEIALDRKGTTLHATFTEYEPYALWCTALDDTPRCYFLDETGYAFAPGPRLDGGALVRHMREGEGLLEKKQAFETESFKATHRFLERLHTELQFRVTDILYTKDGDIHFTVNGGGVLMTKASDSYDVVFENLVTILSSEAFAHLEPGNFQYIDLRFGNKVFVNEEEPSVGTTTDTTGTST